MACTAAHPAQVFTARLGESVNALEGGCITSLTVAEVILHTFSGKVSEEGFLGLLQSCDDNTNHVCHICDCARWPSLARRPPQLVRAC